MTPLGRVLGVGPRTDDDTDRWIVTISLEGNPPRVIVLEPVSSYTEAIDRAEAHTCTRFVFIGSTVGRYGRSRSARKNAASTSRPSYDDRTAPRRRMHSRRARFEAVEGTVSTRADAG